MIPLVIQNILKLQISDLHEKFSALKKCFEGQYYTIEKIFKIVHESERNKSEQAGLLISPILKRLKNRVTICTIEKNNKFIENLYLTIENRPTLYREDLDASYNLMEQITRKNIEQFSASTQEYRKYYTYLFSYLNQHRENLELAIEVTDGKRSFTLYSEPMRQQVSDMRKLFSAFTKNIKDFKDHFPTRALLAE